MRVSSTGIFSFFLLFASVPTGNFGDILAGFYSKQMGLPISNLIIATNENDILHRFLKTGSYEKMKRLDSAIQDSNVNSHPKFEDVKQTLSPAMDILISSNFERFLFHLLVQVHGSHTEASQILNHYMTDLKTIGGFSVAPEVLDMARAHFSSYRASDHDTMDAIRRYYHDGQERYVLDPHTAVGVVAAENLCNHNHTVQTIVLGTASPGKFPDAVLSAINGGESLKAPLQYEDFAPRALVELDGLPKRCIEIKTGGDFKKAVQGTKIVLEGVLHGRV